MHYQAHTYPDNFISGLSNFWPINPSQDDLYRLGEGNTTAEETEYIHNINLFTDQESGYRFIQETKPLAAAYAFTDSPLGFLLWIWSLIPGAVDPTDFQWTAEDAITWSMMYTIQGPYGGMRMYKEMLQEKAFLDHGKKSRSISRRRHRKTDAYIVGAAWKSWI